MILIQASCLHLTPVIKVAFIETMKGASWFSRSIIEVNRSRISSCRSSGTIRSQFVRKVSLITGNSTKVSPDSKLNSSLEVSDILFIHYNKLDIRSSPKIYIPFPLSFLDYKLNNYPMSLWAEQYFHSELHQKLKYGEGGHFGLH